MEVFKTSNQRYRYFLYEVEGVRSIYGISLSGFEKSDHVFHRGISSDGDIRSACARHYADAHSFVSVPYEPGTYHPRIWRGPCSPTHLLATVQEETRAIVAASLLVERMRGLFRNVEPAPQNRDTYGHEIRNLLLLACMEVEANFTAILRANGYAKTGNWTMADYTRLRDVLRLHDYEVRLAGYPDYPAFVPFAEWSPLSSNPALPWWSRYNKTKHDRDGAFAVATITDAIHAIGANVTLLWAQFGSLKGRHGAGSSIAAEFFLDPKSPPPDEFLYLPRHDDKWTATNVPL